MNKISVARSITVGTATDYPSPFVPPFPFVSLNLPPYIADEEVEPILPWFKPNGVFIGLRPVKTSIELVAFAVIRIGDPGLTTFVVGNVADIDEEAAAALFPSSDEKLIVGLGYHRTDSDHLDAASRLEFIDPERLVYLDHIDGPEVVDHIEQCLGSRMLKNLLHPRAA